jgi:deoxyribodipyrimidine photo-lyase
MDCALYWFRNDLRLTDNPAFSDACARSRTLVPVYVVDHEAQALTRWGFLRWGEHRRRFRDQALLGLKAALRARGSDLIALRGKPTDELAALAAACGADTVLCERIAAPEEIDQVETLRAAGLHVEDRWQSSLLDPADLPFDIAHLPDVFTPFRQAIEKADVRPRAAIPAPEVIPPLPQTELAGDRSVPQAGHPDARTSFPYDDARFNGSEAAALAHVERYFSGPLPRSYKATRNGLSGTDYSTKLSPWLATGAVSPRTVHEALLKHEDRFGVSDGSRWIVFELLWRDYFRFSSLKHGRRLFRHNGLSTLPYPSHHAEAFAAWCSGQTGQPFVDAGMRELAATGYLSNRMRQIVPSYLIHDLACDWRAGAAWFEAQLIDYDVCSNQGNWLYIAGRGTDPRQGRRFDPEYQAQTHDPDGQYRRLWAQEA